MSILRILTDGVVNDVNDNDDDTALTNIDDAEVDAPTSWRLLGTAGNAGNDTLSTSCSMSPLIPLVAMLLSGMLHVAAHLLALFSKPTFMVWLPHLRVP